MCCFLIVACIGCERKGSIWIHSWLLSHSLVWHVDNEHIQVTGRQDTQSNIICKSWCGLSLYWPGYVNVRCCILGYSIIALKYSQSTGSRASLTSTTNDWQYCSRMGMLYLCLMTAKLCSTANVSVEKTLLASMSSGQTSSKTFFRCLSTNVFGFSVQHY